MITLRLDEKLENSVKHTAQHMGISKSELIRNSIIEFIKNTEKPTAWKLGSDLFGKYASGAGNLSQDRKKLLTEKIKAKNAQNTH